MPVLERSAGCEAGVACAAARTAPVPDAMRAAHALSRTASVVTIAWRFISLPPCLVDRRFGSSDVQSAPVAGVPPRTPSALFLHIRRAAVRLLCVVVTALTLCRSGNLWYPVCAAPLSKTTNRVHSGVTFHRKLGEKVP